MAELKASIEIAALPSDVRAKFLDFPSLPSYHSSCFKSLSAPKPGTELVQGDKVQVTFANGSGFAGVVQENTSTHFSWTGSLPYVFTGTHTFYFTPSSITPGGTTFTQEEKFSGALGWLFMSDGLVERGLGVKEKTRKGWVGFNEDFRRVCEEEAGKR